MSDSDFLIRELTGYANQWKESEDDFKKELGEFLLSMLKLDSELHRELDNRIDRMLRNTIEPLESRIGILESKESESRFA